MYFFVFETLHIGGVETLLLRECPWYQQRGEVCILCKNISGIAEDTFKHLGIRYIRLNKWTPSSIYRAISQMTKDISFIKFYQFKDFLSFQLKYERKGIRCLFYCVHPRCMLFMQSQPKLKRLFGSTFAKFVKKYIETRNVIFMDEATIDASLNYYDILQYKEKCCILLLPYHIDQHQLKQKSDDIFNILTVGRADFPYKGYILGLIEDFDNNFDKMKKSQLTIISTGDDMDELINKIDSVQENVKPYIKLIKGVSPEKLPDYYSQADLYVGLGTTVLEATSFGVPAIVARYDTRKFTSKGFFYENPQEISGKATNEEPAFDKVIETMRMSNQEYKALQQRSLYALKENYDENIILNEFDNWTILNSSRRIDLVSKLFVRFYLWFSTTYLRMRVR